MTWDEAYRSMAWATNTSSEYVKRAAEDLLSLGDYRFRTTTLNTTCSCSAMAEKWDQVEKFNKTLCDGWGFDPSNGTLVKLEHNKEEIMDYTNCYKGEKKMLIPDGDWAYPERMSNYYFRMPLQVHIDGRMYPNDPAQFRPNFKKIIFNDPATIILWNDGTKTVVKCGPDDKYDPEKGYVMCLLKRFCGNDTAMFHKFLKYGMKNYIPEESSNKPENVATWRSMQIAAWAMAGLSKQEIDMIKERRGWNDKEDSTVPESEKQNSEAGKD